MTNLILSYLLSAAGAIRNFSPYLAIMVDQPHGVFQTPWRGYMLDWWVACKPLWSCWQGAVDVGQGALAGLRLKPAHQDCLMCLLARCAPLAVT